MHHWSIHEIPEELIVNSEVDRLLQVFPKARRAGGNYIFVSTLSDAVDPIILTIAEGEDAVNKLAVYLFAADRSKAIHLTKAQASQLDKAPQWRLWCDEYKTEKNYNAMNKDYNEVFGHDADESISREALRVITKANIKAYFGSM